MSWSNPGDSTHRRKNSQPAVVFLSLELVLNWSPSGSDVYFKPGPAIFLVPFFPYRADNATFRLLIPSTEAAWGDGRSQVQILSRLLPVALGTHLSDLRSVSMSEKKGIADAYLAELSDEHIYVSL